MQSTDFEHAALAVIDMQEDFCEPNGTLAVKNGRDKVVNVNKLLALPFRLKIASRDFHPQDHCSFASQHEGKVAFTDTHTIRNPGTRGENVEEQTTTLWPDHCVQGTQGCELIPELDAARLTLVVDKGQDSRVESYSAFGPPFRKPAVAMTELETVLRASGIKELYVCGLAYDYCVKSTAIDAAKLGLKTFVVRDATEAVDSSGHATRATKEELEIHGVVSMETHEFFETYKG